LKIIPATDEVCFPMQQFCLWNAEGVLLLSSDQMHFAPANQLLVDTTIKNPHYKSISPAYKSNCLSFPNILEVGHALTTVNPLPVVSVLIRIPSFRILQQINFITLLGIWNANNKITIRQNSQHSNLRESMLHVFNSMKNSPSSEEKRSIT
jgi:hypothetical protein